MSAYPPGIKDHLGLVPWLAESGILNESTEYVRDIHHRSQTYMVTSGQTLCHTLASRVEGRIALFSVAQAIIHIVGNMLQPHQPRIGIRNGIGGSAGLRSGGFVTGKRVAVDKGMSGGPALDFPQADKVTPSETAISVFELPQGRVGSSCVEDIAHWRVSAPLALTQKRTYLCGNRTY